MESVIPRTVTSRLRLRVRMDPRAAWIWALTAVLVLYLGIDGGGYDLVVRSDAGVVVWWFLLIGAVCGVLPAAGTTRSGRAALALFAGFALWSAIGSTWSLSSERSLEEVSRLACYLGVLALAVTTYGDRQRALRHVVAAIASAVVVIAALALLSRLRPGTFPAAQTTGALLPGAHPRLGWPLNYWNALAALVALGLPLLVAVATSARTLVAQAAAAAAIPLLTLCGYLTFSRGGAIAAAAAVLAFLALAPDRLPKLATLLVGAGGGAALIAGAVHRPAIEQGLTTSAGAHQGASLAVAVILVCVGVAVAQIGIGLAARHGTPPRWLQVTPRRARALLCAAVAAGLVVALAFGAPARVSHAWHDFKQPSTAALHQDSLGRFGTVSGNGRYLYWKTAIDGLSGHWLAGFGPGTFQLQWLPRAPVWSYVRNAHSLYIETLSEVGLVGLVLLGGFLLLILGTAIRRVAASYFETRVHAAAVAAACLAFLISATFDWVWQVPVLPVVVLLLAASVLVPATRGARERARDGSRRVLRAVLVVAGLGGLIAIGVPLASTAAVRQSQAAAAAGDTTAALADARSAVRLEPAAASPHLQEALVLELQHRFDPAVAAARRATAAEPENWQTWLVLSRLQVEAGHPRLAVAAYRRARSLNPRSPLFGQ
jgi:O-Antigen ligase